MNFHKANDIHIFHHKTKRKQYSSDVENSYPLQNTDVV